MPDMDGYEFVEIIKSSRYCLYSLFVTAISNEQKYLSKAYDLGAIDFYLNL
jgi:response regulator RpfG family c-di-GMP phosphodiesterase